ncbi:hypothetical protein EK904_011137 [Melospiza melodia maxima]|nr:hypothetical protein EK904_011137 [Melospiza melodia maxima]
MGLCYCVNKPKCKPLNGAAAWYKFPCYVKNEVPHAEAWIHGTNLSGQSFVVEQLQIEYSFPFIFPPGLFARYSVQINSHVVQRSDGKYQIYAYRGKVPVVVSYRPARGALQPDTLSIASHASLPNIWTAWQAITPLVEELNVLLQEWPGLYYTVHVLCSKCLKRGSPNPHTFPGFGRKDVVEHLLQTGANVHARDDGGLIPLHNACSFGHAEVVSLLLCQGADPNARDNWNYTPLHEAAIKGKIDVCIVCRTYIRKSILERLDEVSLFVKLQYLKSGICRFEFLGCCREN